MRTVEYFSAHYLVSGSGWRRGSLGLMENYTNDNSARYFIAHVHMFGTSFIHLRNPYIIAWWSAAFPGFGHLLLSKYHRGYLLFIWEIVVNLNANINIAMIYSFQGNIAMAKEVLDTRYKMAPHVYPCLPIWNMG